MTTALIGLGANLGDRAATLRDALTRVAALPDTTVVGTSALYETAPWGVLDQPAFLNAVARVETSLTAQALLTGLQEIEATLGRVRDVRWGARTVDLDVLAFGDVVSDDPTLTLPHPRSHLRRFVLVPLLDVDPDGRDPRTGATWRALLDACPDDGAVTRVT